MCSVCQLDLEKCERCGIKIAPVDMGFLVMHTFGLSAPPPNMGGAAWYELIPVAKDEDGYKTALILHTPERCTALRERV